MPKRAGFTVPLLYVALWALIAGGYSCLTLLKLYGPINDYIPPTPGGLDAALSAAMALLIAFRVNRAYERWWEARTLWGTLVNVSRNLAIKVREMQTLDHATRQYLRDLISAFCYGLKDHLRDEASLTKLPIFANESARPDHIPGFIVRHIYRILSEWLQSGQITEQRLWVLDSELRVFMDVCGGCERIKSTLIPLSWRSITWQCIIVYLLILPWGLIDDIGLWTIPVTIIASYVVIAAEVIAHYVEEPFADHEDHLKLESICQGIEQSVSEQLLA